jgi:hypothetical protein
VHGPSLVVDPRAYRWQTHDWAGRPWEEAVVCELHVGTATPEGTFEALRRRLDHFVDTGITAIEIMPVADFSGTRGWGYDGVLLYAPERSYGTHRRPQAPDRRGPRPRHHDAARRGLQPLRPRRKLPACLCLAVLRRDPAYAVGRRDRRGPPRGARLLHPQRELLAAGVPLRRAALRCRRPDRGRLRRAPAGRDRPPGAQGHSGPPRPPRAGERQQRRKPAHARVPRGARASTPPSGTTIIITSPTCC